MRTGIATPARRTTIRRRLRTVAAIAAVAAAGAVVSGCEDNSPVAAPTSTLPAAGPSAEVSTPTVPEYTTDLDLTDDEKKAVDGALVALDQFVTFTNVLYKSGGEDSSGAEDVATDESLEEIQKAAQNMVAEKTSMTGEVTLENRVVRTVKASDNDAAVAVQACSPSQTFQFVTPGNSPATEADMTNPVYEFSIVHDDADNAWKVAKQIWVKEECGL